MSDEINDAPEMENAEEQLQKNLKEMQTKYDTLQKEKEELNKKFGDHTKEVGDLRKKTEELEKILKEKSQTLEDLQKNKEEKSHEEDNKELREEVERRLKLTFAALPPKERDAILKGMTEKDWKKLETEYMEKVKESGYVPDYLKDIIVLPSGKKDEASDVLERVRQIVGLSIAEKNMTPLGGGSSSVGMGKSESLEFKPPMPDGGLTYISPEVLGSLRKE